MACASKNTVQDKLAKEREATSANERSAGKFCSLSSFPSASSSPELRDEDGSNHRLRPRSCSDTSTPVTLPLD